MSWMSWLAVSISWAISSSACCWSLDRSESVWLRSEQSVSVLLISSWREPVSSGLWLRLVQAVKNSERELLMP